MIIRRQYKRIGPHLLFHIRHRELTHSNHTQISFCSQRNFGTFVCIFHQLKSVRSCGYNYGKCQICWLICLDRTILWIEKSLDYVSLSCFSIMCVYVMTNDWEVAPLSLGVTASRCPLVSPGVPWCPLQSGHVARNNSSWPQLAEQ